MSDCHIREAQQSDLPGIARVRVDTWRATYRGIVPDDFMDKLSYQTTEEGWRKSFWENRGAGVAVFVAERENNEIVGVAVCGPERGHDPFYHGEIYVLYVLPAYQNQGIGRRLVAACVQHLINEVHTSCLLIWTFVESPYKRFYESLHGKPVRNATKELGGRMIPEVGYGWDEMDQLLMKSI